MHINRYHAFLSMAATLGAGSAVAQAEMHIVGRTGFDVGGTVYTVGDRGAGLGITAVDDRGWFVAARWRPGDGIRTIPTLPDTTFVTSSGTSPTLDVLAADHHGLGTNRPGYWTESTGLIEVPLPDAEPLVDRGLIFTISTNGVAACQVSYPPRPGAPSGVGVPATYSPTAGRRDIAMPDGFGARPRAISRDGTMISGSAGTASFEIYPWRWSEATGFEYDATFPQRVQASDPQRTFWSTTPDGRYFVGSIRYVEPTDVVPFYIIYTRSFIWEWGVGGIELPVPREFDANLNRSEMFRGQVSEDATRILTEGGDWVTSLPTERWIYDDPFNPDALPILATEFFEQKGIDLAGWTNFRTQRMSRDGTTFGGTGLLNGEGLMWMIYIPPECPADVNDDGQLTPADFHAWIEAYTEHRIVADQNLDVYITPSDFYAWILNYNEGCD